MNRFEYGITRIDYQKMNEDAPLSDSARKQFPRDLKTSLFN